MRVSTDVTAYQHQAWKYNIVRETMSDTKHRHHQHACYCTMSSHYRLTACVMCRERVNLSVQLKDTKTVVGRLQWVVGLALHIIAFFIYLTIFNVSCCNTLSLSLSADRQASVNIGLPSSMNNGKVAHRN